MSEERQFPVMKDFGVEGQNRDCPKAISWFLAAEAHKVYERLNCARQSLDRIAERGGFYASELDVFVPDWESRTRKEMAMTTEVFRGEFREIDLDSMRGRVKVDGKHMYVCFADTPEMRAIVPGLLGLGEVTFYAKPHNLQWYRVMAVETDNNQTGASE